MPVHFPTHTAKAGVSVRRPLSPRTTPKREHDCICIVAVFSHFDNVLCIDGSRDVSTKALILDFSPHARPVLVMNQDKLDMMQLYPTALNNEVQE